MSIERWGAFSVIDYKDARTLAAEVLLYDHLLIPTPMDWDRPRWIKEGWAPELLDNRLEQLGEVAIRAQWDLDAQKDWKSKFESLREDVRDINAAMEITRRVLVDQARNYRPASGGPIEVFSAHQSEADFQAAELRGAAAPPMAEFDFLIAQRIAIPDDADPEESLRRALGVVAKKEFLDRRRRFHDWQHDILSRGALPKDAADDLTRLVHEYNEAVQKASRSYRIETAMMMGGLGAIALGAVSTLAPDCFTGLGIGVLAGQKVVSIGATATGAVLQIAKHVRSWRDPDSGTRKELVGAMFHQLEQETGWRLRGGSR